MQGIHPASLVSDSYEKDLTKYNGQEIEFVISEFNPKKRRIIGDRKQLLVATKKVAQEELLSKIAEGQLVEGTVKNVTDFGAFIDLGGLDGLLHISEMSWGRIDHPKKMFKVGDTVKALVKENACITLSGDPTTWVSIITHDSAVRDDIGYISSINVGGTIMTGNDFRIKVMGGRIRSHCFAFTYTPNA